MLYTAYTGNIQLKTGFTKFTSSEVGSIQYVLFKTDF